MQKIILSMLVGALAFCSARAYAQDPGTTANLRCLIVGLRASETSNPTVRSAGMMLSMYYLGRLDAHVPKLDIEEPLIKQISTMTAAEYKSEGIRCGTSLTAKGQQITRIGQDMIQRGSK